ncbi:uncharacterized protein BT62DRAFT_17521 [Guyanagaster necrorhizus]|uniref:Uncharacterized protein n=1 Tax=Guyanagaster necrorhizus TaxID=856835 RepID=A0A9P8B049_9AGAR|nr:uncharacterized protein BT62DRAFT_17521 [Guyanagaster necrorhizus MCA 3950]KAG7452662.1 hypothetical protein BT62DRAFT_17521 [Guyanagaster necrorhizus MCA 3950]
MEYDTSIRAVSPTSSIGSTCHDKTSPSDDELPQSAFERKWEEKIGLGRQRADEEKAECYVLFARPTTPSSEQSLYERILHNLRCEVDQIRDSEIFERSVSFGLQDILDQPSTNNVEEILQSMMSASSKTGSQWADDCDHSFTMFGSNVRASSSTGKRDNGSQRLAR